MLPNLYPATVVTYDEAAKRAQIVIPGQTDGAEEHLTAEFCLPVGDKSEHTSLRVLPGDRVWVAFLGGDFRRPIIMGYRPKQTEPTVGVRRLHHANLEFTADTNVVVEGEGGSVTIKAGTKVRIVAPVIELEAQQVKITAATIDSTGQLNHTGNALIAGGLGATGSAAMTGGLQVSGDMTNNGVNVGSTHTHGGVARANNRTDAPG